MGPPHARARHAPARPSTAGSSERGTGAIARRIRPASAADRCTSASARPAPPRIQASSTSTAHGWRCRDPLPAVARHAPAHPFGVWHAARRRRRRGPSAGAGRRSSTPPNCAALRPPCSRSCDARTGPRAVLGRSAVRRDRRPASSTSRLFTDGTRRGPAGPYLRRQDDLLVSHYQQVVKLRATRPLVDGSPSRTCRRRTTTTPGSSRGATCAARAAGGPPLRAGRFVEQSLLADFVDATGLDVRAEELAEVPARNESIDAESVELLRLLNIHRAECGTRTCPRDRRLSHARPTSAPGPPSPFQTPSSTGSWSSGRTPTRPSPGNCRQRRRAALRDAAQGPRHHHGSGSTPALLGRTCTPTAPDRGTWPIRRPRRQRPAAPPGTRHRGARTEIIRDPSGRTPTTEGRRVPEFPDAPCGGAPRRHGEDRHHPIQACLHRNRDRLPTSASCSPGRPASGDTSGSDWPSARHVPRAQGLAEPGGATPPELRPMVERGSRASQVAHAPGSAAVG